MQQSRSIGGRDIPLGIAILPDAGFVGKLCPETAEPEKPKHAWRPGSRFAAHAARHDASRASRAHETAAGRKRTVALVTTREKSTEANDLDRTAISERRHAHTRSDGAPNRSLDEATSHR